MIEGSYSGFLYAKTGVVMKRFGKGNLGISFAIVSLFSVMGKADNRVYWGNESGGEIRYGNLDGSGETVLIGGEGGPCGVAIDSAAGKIYWTNFNSNTLRVANLDGSNVQTLYADSGSLCGVALDPAANKIYWANFGSNEIRTGSLDGVDPAATLYAEASGSAPSGLTVDLAAGKLYWTSQFSDEVRVGDLDGSGSAATVYGAEDNPIGIAIDVATQTLYWTDLNSGEVRTGAADGSGASTLFAGENTPGGVAIDPIDGTIYWASFSGGLIRTGNLDGTGAVTLFSGESNPLFAALLKKPIGEGAPVISGNANIGEVLSCSLGDWAADLQGAFLYRAPQNYAFTWSLNGVDIPGANASTYMPINTGRYTCSVAASNEAGSETQTSNRLNVRCPLSDANCKEQ